MPTTKDGITPEQAFLIETIRFEYKGAYPLEKAIRSVIPDFVGPFPEEDDLIRSANTYAAMKRLPEFTGKPWQLPPIPMRPAPKGRPWETPNKMTPTSFDRYNNILQHTFPKAFPQPLSWKTAQTWSPWPTGIDAKRFNPRDMNIDPSRGVIPSDAYGMTGHKPPSQAPAETNNHMIIDPSVLGHGTTPTPSGTAPSAPASPYFNPDSMKAAPGTSAPTAPGGAGSDAATS